MAKISVIIPCYNRATLVGETIKNMLSQTYAPHEIIVVDDGSTDHSAAVISSFGGIVRLIRQTNQGPGAARNAGLKVATGEFIQFMDSDDLMSANKLECQLAALQDTAADIAYGPWIHCYIKDKTIQFTDSVLQPRKVPDSKPLLEWFVSGWSLVFQNCLFRRSALDKAGLYRTDLMPSEDSEYFIRILMHDPKIVHTPDCLVFYREHDMQKITASGTSVLHRVDDWTKFLTITGAELKDKLSGMAVSTRLALAAQVNAHLRHVKRVNARSLPVGHPYEVLIKKYPALAFTAFSCYQRIQRKLKGTADFHSAFRRKRIGDHEIALVQSINYKLISAS